MYFRLSGQKVIRKPCTKYLGVLLEENLLFKNYINTLKQKLNEANGILAKLRHYLPSDILKTIYYFFLIHTYVMHVRFGDKAAVTYY